MKKNPVLSAVLSLFLLVPASITWAQTISSQKGLTTAVFNLQQGVITVYLPDDIRPGDHISGSMLVEPAGKNEKQIGMNRVELNAYSVRIYNQVFSAANTGKPFEITVPAGRPQRCDIELTGISGIKTPAVTVPSIPETDPPATPNTCWIPSHVLAGSPFRITGPFDGDASNTSCKLDNKPLNVLAESPRACIVSYPADAGGTHTVTTQESGKPECSKQVSGVDLDLKAGKLNLRRGEKTYVDVTVTGLQGLPDTARLKVTNPSTNVITLSGGNTITILIQPQSISTGGTYTQRFDIQSIQNGTFTVNAGIDLPETGQPLATVKSQPDLRIIMTGSDISVNENGKHLDSKIMDPVQVHFQGNTIIIYFNGLHQTGFDLANTGDKTVQELIEEFSNPEFQAEVTDCDSLTRICRKNAALNVFWGDVYSILEGKAVSRLVKGEPIEKNTTSSLLITRGWEINCCSGEYQLKLFFQGMRAMDGKESHNVSFTKILKTGKPCTIICPECRQKCKELEDQKKNNGFGN